MTHNLFIIIIQSGVYSSEALKKKQEKEKKKNEYFLKHGHRPIEYNFELPIRSVTFHIRKLLYRLSIRIDNQILIILFITFIWCLLLNRRAQCWGDMSLYVVRNFPSNEVRSEYPKQKSPTENPEEKEIRPIPPVRTRPNQLLSEKRLEHLRPKNEFSRDVGQLSLPECIKVNRTLQMEQYVIF